MTQTKIAVIGGSGIYDIDGLEDATWTTVDSPWGAPSDQILTGTLDGVAMAFLPLYLMVIDETISDLERQGVKPEVILAFRGKAFTVVSTEP